MSEHDENDFFKERLSKIWDVIFREAKFDTIEDAPVYNVPYRAKVLHAPDGELVEISIPCVRKTWWILFAPSAVLGLFLSIFFGITLGFGVDYALGRTYWMPDKLLIFLVITTIALYFLYRFCYPRISIEASISEGIIIGQYGFDWDKTQGLRLGYSAGGKDHKHEQLIYDGLRMTYGAWGFDLPYMVHRYHAAAYVVWINIMLETVGQNPENALNDPQAGFIKDLF